MSCPIHDAASMEPTIARRPENSPREARLSQLKLSRSFSFCEVLPIWREYFRGFDDLAGLEINWHWPKAGCSFYAENGSGWLLKRWRLPWLGKSPSPALRLAWVPQCAEPQLTHHVFARP